MDQGSHEVIFWELNMDLMKLGYKDLSWISWSLVKRIENRSHVVVLLEFDHRSHEVELWGLIMDLMKLSYKD